jgi:hypothetical protein
MFKPLVFLFLSHLSLSVNSQHLYDYGQFKSVLKQEIKYTSIAKTPEGYVVKDLKGDTLFDYNDNELQFSVLFNSISDTGLLYVYPFFWNHSNMKSIGNYGYITREGKVIVPPIYDASLLKSRFIEPENTLFFHGRARVMIARNKFFFINGEGEKVLPADSSYYLGATPFNYKGLAFVSRAIDTLGNYESYWINRKGEKYFEGIEFTKIGGGGNVAGNPAMFSSGYVPMALQTKKKKEFFMLNPSKQETFRIKETPGYRLIESYNYDNYYKLNDSLGYGLVIAYRARKKSWVSFIKKKLTDCNMPHEIMLISFDGDIIQDWTVVCGYKGSIEIRDSTFYYQKTEELVFNVDITILEKEEKVNWSSDEEFEAYFKDFKPQFDKAYLREYYDLYFPRSRR